MLSVDVVTDVGKGLITGLLLGSPIKYMGWGTGTGTAEGYDVVLFGEVSSSATDSNGYNCRVECTIAQVTTNSTNDTFQITGTLIAPGTLTISNIGVFDAPGGVSDSVPPSGGNLFLHASLTTPLTYTVGQQITFVLNYVVS